MTLICGIDPGTESPGFTVIDTSAGFVTWCSDKPPPFAVHAAVVESGWPHGPMGKLAMWGLGFRACMQLLSVHLIPYDLHPLGALGGRFKIAPDCWRSALPDRPGQLTIQPRQPKTVTVNRLRLRYNFAPLDAGGPSDDIVESRGICEGAVHVLARKLKKDRKGLVAVT